MQSTTVFVLLIAVVPCFSQRPFYAGLKPIGYPAVQTTTVVVEERFGEDLPAVLKGDVEYANRLDKLPEAQQPIWYLNQKHYENQLKNPQTYPQRPSIFNENSRNVV